MTTETPQFKAAYPYNESVLTLPVTDLDQTAKWYSHAFGMQETRRAAGEKPSVVLHRDGVELGFEINCGDAANEGAAILVEGIEALRQQLIETGASPGEFRIDDRDGEKLKVFFVVAPDGLCFYFHQGVEE